MVSVILLDDYAQLGGLNFSVEKPVRQFGIPRVNYICSKVGVFDHARLGIYR